MRYKYRVSKYDPKNRNENGFYQQEDWTAISDIGKTFSFKLLSKEEYENIESNYLFAIESFLIEAQIYNLNISSIERGSKYNFIQGQTLELHEILAIAQLSLREELWCKLSLNRKAYIHFGYDFYMYIAVPRKCNNTLHNIQNKGLFIEAYRSPYLRGKNPAEY